MPALSHCERTDGRTNSPNGRSLHFFHSFLLYYYYYYHYAFVSSLSAEVAASPLASLISLWSVIRFCWLPMAISYVSAWNIPAAAEAMAAGLALHNTVRHKPVETISPSATLL